MDNAPFPADDVPFTLAKYVNSTWLDCSGAVRRAISEAQVLRPSAFLADPMIRNQTVYPKTPWDWSIHIHGG